MNNKELILDLKVYITIVANMMPQLKIFTEDSNISPDIRKAIIDQIIILQDLTKKAISFLSNDNVSLAFLKTYGDIVEKTYNLGRKASGFQIEED